MDVTRKVLQVFQGCHSALQRTLPLLLLVFLLAPVSQAQLNAEGTGQPDVEELVILHDNDQHFHFNHAGDFKETVAALRASRPNVFLFNAGDIFVRHRHRWAENSIEYYERMASFMIDQMNAVGYDLMVLGNHEIDYREEATLRQLQRATFPILGANVSSNTSFFFTPPAYQVLRTAAGRRLAILGLSVGSAPGVRVRGRANTVREYLHLRDESDLFVLLTHVGYHEDLRLAGRFPQVDIIIGGHSHSLLHEAEAVNSVLVAQAGGHPHVDGGHLDTSRPMNLGVIQVIFAGDEVVDKRGRVFFVTQGKAEQVTTEIERWLDERPPPNPKDPVGREAIPAQEAVVH